MVNWVEFPTLDDCAWATSQICLCQIAVSSPSMVMPISKDEKQTLDFYAAAAFEQTFYEDRS